VLKLRAETLAYRRDTRTRIILYPSTSGPATLGRRREPCPQNVAGAGIRAPRSPRIGLDWQNKPFAGIDVRVWNHALWNRQAQTSPS